MRPMRQDLRLSLILSATAILLSRRRQPLSFRCRDKTQRLVRPDQCDFTMSPRGPSEGAVRLNNSTETPPLEHSTEVTLSTSEYLPRSCKIPQSNNNLVHKSCQLHLLNLTTSHIPALSLPPSPFIYKLSIRSISLNASLN